MSFLAKPTSIHEGEESVLNVAFFFLIGQVKLNLRKTDFENMKTVKMPKAP